ncbi:hypothetical protein Lser_V15G14034 [Lactuca serriola]
MAGFHLPGDPYFPNQGNDGWIVEDPEEDSEEEPMEDEETMEDEEPMEEEESVDGEEEEEEEDSDGTDSEPEVYNPHPTPVPPQHYQGPTPQWAETIHRWSREQGQRPPYGMQWGFYDLSRGGSADQALPVIVHRVTRHEEQTRINTRHLMEVGATSQVNSVRILRLDDDHDRTRDRTELLRREMASTRAEVQELQEHRAALEGRLTDAKRQAAESRKMPPRRNPRRGGAAGAPPLPPPPPPPPQFDPVMF